MTVRFLHLADSHIGKKHRGMRMVNGRNLMSLDVQNAFQEAIELAEKEKVDFILHSGDLFDKKVIGIRSMMDFISILKNTHIPFYVIAGNHDRLRSGSNHIAINFIRDLDGVYVIDTPQNLHIGSTIIHAIPYHRRKHFHRFSTVQEHLLQERAKTEIMMFHQSVIGFNLGYTPQPGENILHYKEISPQLNYVAMGHIHIRQYKRHWQNSEQIQHYPGSPVVVNFAERLDVKALTLVSITKDDVALESISLPSRRFFSEQVSIDPYGWEAQLEEIAEKLIDPESYLGIRLRGSLKESSKFALQSFTTKYRQFYAGIGIYTNQLQWV
ncbi:MAG: DNA repair exonuclease [Candidatus Heimdallarchaeota archaeon]|nr:DNA repair exonuclease [Candidatus Heimdallarchaeota archaeon]